MMSTRQAGADMANIYLYNIVAHIETPVTTSDGSGENSGARSLADAPDSIGWLFVES